jgi:hypothetical protein
MQCLRFTPHLNHTSLKQTPSFTPAHDVIQAHIDMFRTNICPLEPDTEPITTYLIHRQAGIAPTIPAPVNVNSQQTTLGSTHTYFPKADQHSRYYSITLTRFSGCGILHADTRSTYRPVSGADA